MDLFNVIFCGFYMVKGGVGFFQLNVLVECCYIVENVFDILCKGEWCVSFELMDVVLQVLDMVNVMFDQVCEQFELILVMFELLVVFVCLVEFEGVEFVEFV